MMEFALWAKSAHHRYRVERAKRQVDHALSKGSAYVLVSGGKDSVALLGLVRELAPETPAWYIDIGLETPDTEAVLAQLEREHGLQRISPRLSVDAMAEQVGGWGYEGPNKLPGEWHWRTQDWREILIDEPNRRLCAEHGYQTFFTGLRADESHGRRMRRRMYGYLHQRKDGIYHACPLLDWSGMDSLAYAAAQGLPISKLYTRPGPKRPEDRRTATVMCLVGLESEGMIELRRNHPEFYAQVVERFPMLRSHL